MSQYWKTLGLKRAPATHKTLDRAYNTRLERLIDQNDVEAIEVLHDAYKEGKAALERIVIKFLSLEPSQLLPLEPIQEGLKTILNLNLTLNLKLNLRLNHAKTISVKLTDIAKKTKGNIRSKATGNTHRVMRVRLKKHAENIIMIHCHSKPPSVYFIANILTSRRGPLGQNSGGRCYS